MSDEEDGYNPTSHKNLLKNISNLGKSQHIRKATRNEPQLVVDEFHLVKPQKSEDDVRPKEGKVAVGDIVKILKNTDKHIEAGKNLRNVVNNKKVLPKPLEKPKADRIKRTIGYENVKNKLGRWDAIVAKNRTAETQIFPLPSETIYVDTSTNSKSLPRSLKSSLALEMEEAESKLKSMKKELYGDLTDEKEQARIEEELLKKKMTKDEIIAYRKELAYLRLKESQRSAKARLKNKIKSKKYHKLMKRQKLKEQMKEFELLQKTNPEAALEKLEAIEKNRALERANLRHKNTGSWAKNLQVRAKYDKDVRKDLAEQLQMSREITQKNLNQSSDEEEDLKTEDFENGELKSEVDPFNPWIKVTRDGNKPENEDDPNWRKYWIVRNANEKLLEDYRKDFDQVQSENNDDENPSPENEAKKSKKSSLSTEINKENQALKSKPLKETKKLKKGKQKTLSDEDQELLNEYKMSLEAPTDESNESSNESDSKVESKPSKGKVLKKTKVKNLKTTSEPSKKISKNSKAEEADSTEELEKVPPKKNLKKSLKKQKNSMENKNIDDIFDEVEDIEREKMERKLKKALEKNKKLKEREKKLAQKKALGKLKVKEKNELKNLEDLSFKNQSIRPDIDEELTYNDDEKKNGESKPSDVVKSAEGALKNSTDTNTGKSSTTEEFIDPNKFATIKLQSNLVDFNGMNEGLVDEEADLDDEGDNHQMTISEAFEDDDIVADFSKQKKEESEIKNAELDLFMPGWGSWAGAGITKDPEAIRNKRIKFTVDEERKDKKKDAVIINEDANKHLRNHLVSDLPFPFTSLKDYEASIRAPLGRSFVPETAFRMLTRPAVIAKKGQVIDPMDESEIVKPNRKLRHVVDRRIKHVEKEKLKIKKVAQKQRTFALKKENKIKRKAL